jgi:PEP-CTERM motif
VISGTACFDDPPPAPAGTISDCLRFTDSTGVINGSVTAAGSTQLIFYSIAEAPFAPADTGFPTNIGTGNLTTLVETVNPDGSSGFDYLPAGVHYPSNNEFVAISDEATVPEPGTLALLGSAVAAMGLAIRRRRQ